MNTPIEIRADEPAPARDIPLDVEGCKVGFCMARDNIDQG